MKALLKKVLVLLAELLRDALGILTMLLIALLAFVLFTEAGAVLTLRTVENATDGMLVFEEPEGRLWGTLRLRSLRYEDGAVRVQAQDVDLRWSPLALLSKRLSVSRLHVNTLALDLKPSASPPPEDEGGEMLSELPLALSLRDLALNRLTVRPAGGEPIVLERLALSAGWRGRRVEVQHLAALTPWVGALELQGRVQLGPDAVDIDTLTLTGFVEAHLEGRYGYTAATPSDLRLAWQNLQWPPQGEPELRSERGRLQWTGHLDDYGYELQAALEAAGYALAAEARGTGSLEQIRAETLQVDALGGRITARAEVDWRQDLAIDADGRIAGFDPKVLHEALEGRINGRFQAKTQIERGQPRVAFELALDDSALRGYPLRLDARGRYANDAVDLAQFELRTGATRMDASGRVWPQLDARMALVSRDLSGLWPDLHGRADLKLAAQGTYEAPRLDAQGQFSQLRYQDLRVTEAKLNTQLDLRRSLMLQLQAQGLEVGTEIQRLNLSVQGPPSAHRIEFDARAAQGRVSLAAEGALDLDAQRWRGQLASSRLAPDRLAAWTLQEAVALQVGPGLDLAPACWAAGDARACVRVQVEGERQRLAFRLEGFELESLSPLLPAGTSLQTRLDGRGVVALDARGLRELDVELDSSAGQFRQAGLPPLRWKPAQLRAAESDRGIELLLNLPMDEGEVALEGLLAGHGDLMQRAVSGRLRVVLPTLDFVRALSPEVQDIAGRIDGEATFAGTLAQLQPRGFVALSEGRVRLATPGIELRELQARVDAQGAQPLQVSARMRADEGELYIGGDVDPWSDPLRLNLKLSGYNAQVVRTPEVKVWVSPNLTIALAEQQLRVTGTVEVPRADIAPTSLSSGVGPSADQVIVESDDAPADSGLGIHADIGLKLGEAVRFEGFGLKTRFTGNLQLREAPGTPTSGRGEINLIEGRYKAYGQDLNIETGRLLFTGGAVTAPAVELRATRQPRPDITVGVLVRGTLEKPQLSLFSTPTMSQQQQLSWLVLGRDLEQSSGAEDRELLAGAALSMGLAGGEWLAQRFGGAIGVDQVSVGAKPGESAEQAQLTVGKFLAPGLFISYGIGLFQPGHTFKLEYDIGKGFKLATESGVESGGDLLYTIESKAHLRAPPAAADMPAPEPDPTAAPPAEGARAESTPPSGQ